MKHIARQVWRGCGRLPHVGIHPGTPVIVVLPLFGLIAGGLVGYLLLLVIFIPLYVVGAYDRAEYSDRQEATHER